MNVGDICTCRQAVQIPKTSWDNGKSTSVKVNRQNEAYAISAIHKMMNIATQRIFPGPISTRIKITAAKNIWD
jgi:hypothetical protein